MEKSLKLVSEETVITPPVDSLGRGFELYHGSNVDIMLTRRPIKVCSYEHAHEGYEFFVPLRYSPRIGSLTIDNGVITPKPGSLIPANPGQPHGVRGDFVIDQSVCIYIHRDYLEHIAYTVSGVKQVFFSAKNNPYNRGLQNLVEQFVSEARAQQAGYRYILESLSTQMVIEILRNTENSIHEKMNRTETGVRENILKAIEYLKENFDQKLSNAELLDIANLSPYYFIRLFKKETGKTPHEFLINLKIEKAKELLVYSSYTVTEICFICGFNEHSHFSRVFKKTTGLTPLGYRRTHKTNSSTKQ